MKNGRGTSFSFCSCLCTTSCSKQSSFSNPNGARMVCANLSANTMVQHTAIEARIGCTEPTGQAAVDLATLRLHGRARLRQALQAACDRQGQFSAQRVMPVMPLWRKQGSTASPRLVLGDRKVGLRLLRGSPPLEEGFCRPRPEQQDQTCNRRRSPHPSLSDLLRAAFG